MSLLTRIESIRAALKNAGAMKDDLQVEANGLRRNLELTRRKRDALRTAPADRADIKSAMTAYLARQRARYIENLAANLRPFFHNAENLRSPQAIKRAMTLVGVAVPDGEFVSRDDVDGCLAALFGEQLLSLIHAAIDECEWQTPAQGAVREVGLPLTKRDAAVKKLDDEITAMQAQFDALVSGAEDAGINLEFEAHF